MTSLRRATFLSCDRGLPNLQAVSSPKDIHVKTFCPFFVVKYSSCHKKNKTLDPGFLEELRDISLTTGGAGAAC